VIFAASAPLHGQKAAEAEVVIDSDGAGKGGDLSHGHQARPADHRAVLESGRSARRAAAPALHQIGAPEPAGATLAAAVRSGARKRAEECEGCAPLAGRLGRELTRKRPAEAVAAQAENFALYRRVLAQKPRGTGKIYRLHEPHIYGIAKGRGAQEV